MKHYRVYNTLILSPRCFFLDTFKKPLERLSLPVDRRIPVRYTNVSVWRILRSFHLHRWIIDALFCLCSQRCDWNQNPSHLRNVSVKYPKIKPNWMWGLKCFIFLCPDLIRFHYGTILEPLWHHTCWSLGTCSILLIYTRFKAIKWHII